MKPTLSVALAMQAGLVGLALAQSPPPAASPAGSLPGYGTVDHPTQSGEPEAPDDAADAIDLPVLYVTGVEVLRTAIEPKLDIVRVSGVASSPG